MNVAHYSISLHTSSHKIMLNCCSIKFAIDVGGTVLNHLILGTALILMMQCVSQMDYLISLQSRISTKKPQLITMSMKRITVVKEC